MTLGLFDGFCPEINETEQNRIKRIRMPEEYKFGFDENGGIRVYLGVPCSRQIPNE